MPLGDALAEFLRDSKLLQRKKQQPAYDAWDEAVGPEIARQARAVSFRRGELIVEVDSTSSSPSCAASPPRTSEPGPTPSSRKTPPPPLASAS